MNPKYSVSVIGLSIALIGCDSGAPEPNAVNCSLSGLEKVLPHFESESERQAFIDACSKTREEK